MRRHIPAVGIILSVVFAAPLLGDGLIVVNRPVTVPPDRFPFAPLEVKYHRVNVEIEDQVAKTRVDQVFLNPTGQRLEGHYLFPVPRGPDRVYDGGLERGENRIRTRANVTKGPN